MVDKGPRSHTDARQGASRAGRKAISSTFSDALLSTFICATADNRFANGFQLMLYTGCPLVRSFMTYRASSPCFPVQTSRLFAHLIAQLCFRIAIHRSAGPYLLTTLPISNQRRRYVRCCSPKPYCKFSSCVLRLLSRTFQFPPPPFSLPSPQISPQFTVAVTCYM